MNLYRQHILFDLIDAKPNLISVGDKKMFEPVMFNGISINSMGFILDANKAAVWRGPMLSGAIRQLIESTIWGELDFLFIDMPPGTGDAYLTIASEIKPDKPYFFFKQWKRVREEAELVDFRFHDLRHTTASYLAQNGATLIEIAEILGHKDISVTKRYAHLCIEHKSSLINRVMGGI